MPHAGLPWRLYLHQCACSCRFFFSPPPRTLTTGDPQRPHCRRHRLAVVRRRHRHPRRAGSPPSGIWKVRRAKRMIDAHGMVVAPGFIDMLGQSETTILVNPHLPSKIYQGITTEITGEGGSIAPLNRCPDRARPRHLGALRDQPDVANFPRILRARCASRAWESTWRATSAPHRCGAWCIGDGRSRAHRGRTGTDESAGARGDARRRGGSIHLAAICPGALRQDGGTDRAGVGSGASSAAFTRPISAMKAMA